MKLKHENWSLVQRNPVLEKNLCKKTKLNLICIPQMAIMPILTSMISILTNPLIMKKIRYSEEMRRFCTFVIMKCDERWRETNKRKVEKEMS